MTSLRGVVLILVAGSWLCACGTDEAASAEGSGGGAGAAAAVVCDLGTMYPSLAVIDPDAPQYSDANWAAADVAKLFAQAKIDQDLAYLAYRAARDHAGVLDCAFCSCGCAPSVGHLSALDCFKDMHGFA